MPDDVLIWSALADPKRRQIVNLLQDKPRTTSELSERFDDVSRFAIMKHLNVLEQADLIKVKREGRNRWNILNDNLVHFLRTKLVDDNGPYRLEDILGLVPTRKPAAPADLMHVQQNITLNSSPAQVFAALTVDIDAWWSLRISPDSRICVEPFVNGRFYEAFDTSGQGSLYGTITYIKQNEAIRLRGTLELVEQAAIAFAADNFVHIHLEPEDNTTQLVFHHYIFGGLDEQTRDVCASYWHNVLNQHLKPFVEEGIPYQHNP